MAALAPHRSSFAVVTWSLLGACYALSGCGEIREPFAGPSDSPRFTYVDDVRPLLAKRCVRCHGGASPAGEYDLSSWPGLLGPGSDQIVRNAIPGKADSLLVERIASGKGVHAGLLSSSELQLLRSWIVEDRLAYFQPSFHPRGWLYPGDRNALTFHGGALRARAWDTTPCKKCHGGKLDGGRSGFSCKSCHIDGVDGCSTCHGGTKHASPPPDLSWRLDPKTEHVGAHRAHVTTTLFGTISCNTCHPAPRRVGDPGHLFDDEKKKTSDLEAEIRFGPRARQHATSASWNEDKTTCRVYCHRADHAPDKRPNWTEPNSVKCGSCHPVPHAAPRAFGGKDCSICHRQSVRSCKPGATDCLRIDDETGVRFIRRTLHGDGKSPVGAKGAEDTCYGCHGTKDSAGGPPPDLHGNTEISAIGVGLHAVHLAKTAVTDGVPCASCHVVPKKLTDKGHIDSKLPAEVTFDSLADGTKRYAKSSLSPVWNRTAKTCSNTYCHGLDGAKVKKWTWTAKLPDGTSCDSCHGFPPDKTLSGKKHPTNLKCASCHAAYRGGKLDPARHIDGKVEVSP